MYSVAVALFKRPDRKSLVVCSLRTLSLCQYFLLVVDDSPVFIIIHCVFWPWTETRNDLGQVEEQSGALMNQIMDRIMEQSGRYVYGTFFRKPGLFPEKQPPVRRVAASLCSQ